MATPIIMPKAGVAMESGTIIQWLKEPGDPVANGEIILEIETDKVSMEVEAETSGFFLGSIANPGDEVAVTLTIGYIGEKDEKMPEGSASPESAGPGDPLVDGSSTEPTADSDADIAATIAAEEKGIPSQTPVSGAASVGSGPAGPRIAASPAAVKAAREQGITLTQVASGDSKALHRKDIESFVAGNLSTAGGGGTRMSSLARRELDANRLSPASIQGSGSSGRILRADVVEQGAGLIQTLQTINGFVPPAEVPAVFEEGDESVPLKGIRKVTAGRMTASHLSIPPTTLNRELEVSRLMVLRQDLKDQGIKVSVNVLILMAVARALRECPWMRVSLQNGQIVQRNGVHLGMAVASERGLLVPVIRDADQLSMSTMASRTMELANKARDGKLGIEEMTGGVFSVSNLGMYGITTFTPIVNPPESGILGVGTIRNLLKRNESGEIVDHSVMDLSLTLDHRVIDGAQGAIFLQNLAELIEAPLKLLSGG